MARDQILNAFFHAQVQMRVNVLTGGLQWFVKGAGAAAEEEFFMRLIVLCILDSLKN